MSDSVEDGVRLVVVSVSMKAMVPSRAHVRHQDSP
ncbi:Uncharacterised protein [Mycobacteroides abscessus subsp. abscessus]|nr:Uncharacterised protein [Mycobacteroides abscessus subsp. abscessus]